jgi:hypothetical protein
MGKYGITYNNSVIHYEFSKLTLKRTSLTKRWFNTDPTFPFYTKSPTVIC